MPDGSLIFDTKLDSSGLQQGLKSLGGLAVKGVAAAGTAIGAAGAAAIKFGSDFETSLAKTSTMFGDVNVDTDNLQNKILGLSDKTGVAASQIGESMYNALSAGIPVSEDMGDALTYMEQSAKLAKAGFTDVDTAVISTAKVLNAYKMDISETDKIHRILMQTQNKGITTVGELGSVLAQVTPTAANMGVSFEQVGASLASMTAQGTPTAQATTQLNSLFAELGKQGTSAQKSLLAAAEGTEYAGMTFQDMMSAGVPLNEVLNMMDGYAQDSGKSMLDLFGSLEAGKAALALSGQNSEQFTANLQAMGTEADVVGDAYEKVMGTFAEKTKTAVEGLKNLGIAVYKDMQDPLKEATETGIQYIEQLSAAFQEGGLEGLVGALGDVLAQALTEVVSFAPQLIDAAVSLIQSFVEGIQKNLPQIVDVVVQAGVALIVGILQLLPQLLTIGIQLIGQLVIGIAQALPELIPAAVDAVLALVDALLDNLDLLIDAGLQLIVALIDGLVEAQPKLMEKIPEIIAKILTVIVENLPTIIEAGIQILIALIVGMIQSIPMLVAALPEIIGAIMDAFSKVDWMKLGGDILDGVLQGLVDAGSHIWDAVKKAGGAIVDSFKKFFGIHSPSTLMRDQIGKNMVLGMEVGFDNNLPDVFKDMQNAVNLETARMSARVSSTANYSIAMAAPRQSATVPGAPNGDIFNFGEKSIYCSLENVKDIIRLPEMIRSFVFARQQMRAH